MFFLYTDPYVRGYHIEGDYRATIVCQRNGDNIEYGIAICSGRDNFERKKGRELAIERMTSGFGQCEFNNGFFNSFDKEQSALLEFASTLGRAVRKNFEKYKKRITDFKEETKKEKTL